MAKLRDLSQFQPEKEEKESQIGDVDLLGGLFAASGSRGSPTELRFCRHSRLRQLQKPSCTRYHVETAKNSGGILRALRA